MQVNSVILNDIFREISNTMSENKDLLIQLDAQNGDGDLGISMDSGFRAVKEMLDSLEETDLGKIMLKASKTFNEFAPSTLGTILSFYFMGMAKYLKGKVEIDLLETSEALDMGLDKIMEKAGAKPGEKTIIDSLYPACQVLKESAVNNENHKDAFKDAYEAAHNGMLETKNMKSKHGRAAYYENSSIGLQDGGATVGMLIYESILRYINKSN